MTGKLVVERIEYGGWPNCCRVANGVVEVVITTDVGPRVIRFGFVGEENEFHQYGATLGKTGGSEWHNYGGHRLWHAPEVFPRTYFPDNDPVRLQRHAGWVRTLQTVEATTGIQKEMDIHLSAEGAQVRVVHRLRNTNLWPVELAPWAISVMAAGGTAIIPLPPRGTHPEALLPVNTLTLWAYTDMSDRRWMWGRRYVLAHQEPQASTPQKAGWLVPDGWCAYARGGHLFVVRFEHVPGARYPDMGANVETWIDPEMLELETIGPPARLEPGASVQYVEHWSLFRDVRVPRDEADVERYVLPRLRRDASQPRHRRDASQPCLEVPEA